MSGTSQLAIFRWPQSGGEPRCPTCDSRAYIIRGRPKFRCSGCKRDFSVTTGTLLDRRKMAAEDLIRIVKAVVDSRGSVTSLALAGSVGIQQKSAHVILGKIREAASRLTPGRPLTETALMEALLSPQGTSSWRGYWQRRKTDD